MALIGFTIYKQKILDGSKRQTIRLMRKRPIKREELLHLYWHLRQKDCESLGKQICVEVLMIRFKHGLDYAGSRLHVWDHVFDHWHKMPLEEELDLALRDGFDSIDDFLNWFESRYPDIESRIFQVIRW